MKEEFDPSPDDSRQMARAIVNELGLTEETIDEIRNIPFSELLAAYKRALPGLREKGVNTTWSPVANAYFSGISGYGRIYARFCRQAADHRQYAGGI